MDAAPDLALPRIAERLAPSLPYAHDLPHDGAPRAAVAVILRPGREGAEGGAAPRDQAAEVLLIRRAERDGDPWSGHMAFPGGRSHALDRDLAATAVRETREEVGLDLARDGRLLGRLADLEAIARARRTGLVIAPFVFALERDAPLVVDDREVAAAIWAPLAGLARGEGAATMSYTRDGVDSELPSWHVQGQVVWGLTHRMLRTLLEAVTSRASASG